MKRRVWIRGFGVAVIVTAACVGLVLASITLRSTPSAVPLPRLSPDTQEDASRVIARYRETFPPSKLNGVRLLHTLRNFPKAATLSPQDGHQPTYLSILCDNQRYANVVNEDGLVRDAGGLPAFRKWRGGDDGGEGHVGQFLMFFGEMGVSPDAPLKGEEVLDWSVAALLENAKLNAHGGQDLCWLLPALSHYLSWDEQWDNKFGEQVTLQELAEAHMERGQETQHCSGTHHFYAVATLAQKILDQGREIPHTMRHYLRSRIALAEASQLREGTWTEDWHRGSQCSALHDGSLVPDKAARLRFTGHLLECLALCRTAEHVNPEVIELAIRWICVEAENLISNTRYHENTVLSHAVHGLILSRSQSQALAISNVDI